MKAASIFLISLITFFSSCTNKNPEPVITVRDTTITQENSVSELFIDSTLLEGFILDQQVEDSSANRLRNFYNSRNYQFAWFTEDGMAEQAGAFWNLYKNYIQLSNDSSIIDKQLHQQMEFYINEDTIIPHEHKLVVQTEFKLTGLFFNYAKYAYAGKVDPDELQWHIPRKKINAFELLDSLISNKGQNIDLWEPVNQQYIRMAKQLTRYHEIDKAGGWQEIISDKKINYKQGDSSDAVSQIIRRLSDEGDLDANDSSRMFTEGVTIAIKKAQRRYGLVQTGIPNDELIGNLNVPVKERIKQMLINMERMRWMPKEPSGYRITVNIPDYKLRVYEASEKVFEMGIVVGSEANKTVIFNDVLKYVVFSPYWNITPNIVRNEILPAMKKNRNYLAKKNMEQTGTSNGLPVIRQKPGGNNALGKVKFIFPNSYNIYFHDTPAKSLFRKEKRAFSHGCIRLSSPRKLAEYLLRNQPEWTEEKITEAMNASKEKWVSLKEPIPVVITYFTSWISRDGLLNFREDVYGHDAKMAERLFE